MSDKVDGSNNGDRPLVTKQDAPARAASGPGDDAQPARKVNGESEEDMKHEASTTLTAEVVQLTANLRTLAALEEVVDGLPVVDVTKVERIRFALETGAYRISPQRIADKIVDFERDWDEAAGQNTSE